MLRRKTSKALKAVEIPTDCLLLSRSNKLQRQLEVTFDISQKKYAVRNGRI